MRGFFMALTKVAICNQALNLIGARSIQSFDESTETARRCSALYDSSRQSLLRMHPWSFAKKRMQLAPSAVRPTFGYANAFPLPSNLLRVLDTGLDDYEIEGRYILADTNLINLVYVADEADENHWDSLFTECMVLYLANKLCKPISGSQTEADSAWQKLQNMLKQARTINGQERPTQDFSANYYPRLLGVRN